MRPGSSRLVLLAAFAAVTAVYLFSRQSELDRLRLEAAASAPDGGALARLKEENAKLQATRIPDSELQSLRADHATIARLRNEVDAVQRSLDSNATATEARPSEQGGPPRTLLDQELTKDQWRNAGRSTPAATVETLLWAAAGGDVSHVADTLEMSDETRRKAEELFASLPPEIRKGYQSAANLVALLTAKEAPQGAAQVVAEVPDQLGTVLVTRFKDDYGHARTVALSLRTDGNAWRIDVPPSAIERYATIISADPNAVHMTPVSVQ